MQPLCRSHGWTVVNHYYTQNWGCSVLASLDCGKSLLHTKMLHSLFVPHIVVTVQNWLGLGHAAFVQKSWLDCGKSLLHTKLGSHHVFFAAMLHSLFVPHIVATVPQNWLGLAMQPLCRSHGWTVVNHYYKTGVNHALPQNTKLARSWPCSLCAEVMVGLWSLLHTCVFCGNAALTVCAPHCGHCAPKLARSWPCSLCAEVMIGLW